MASVIRRWARVRRVIRNGYRERYPWCCVLQFAWDSLIGVKSGLVRGVTSERADDGARWVPFRWWHHADPVATAAGYEELVRARRARTRV